MTWLNIVKTPFLFPAAAAGAGNLLRKKCACEWVRAWSAAAAPDEHHRPAAVMALWEWQKSCFSLIFFSCLRNFSWGLVYLVLVKPRWFDDCRVDSLRGLWRGCQIQRIWHRESVEMNFGNILLVSFSFVAIASGKIDVNKHALPVDLIMSRLLFLLHVQFQLNCCVFKPVSKWAPKSDLKNQMSHMHTFAIFKHYSECEEDVHYLWVSSWGGRTRGPLRLPVGPESCGGPSSIIAQNSSNMEQLSLEKCF